MEEENKQVEEEVKEEAKPVEEPKKENFLTKKKEVKGRPLRIWIIIMIIIFMLFTFGIGLSLGKRLAEKDTKKETQEPKEETKIETLTETEAEGVMQKFKALAIKENNLYKSDKYEISAISDDELFLTALSKFAIPSVCSEDSMEKEITAEMLNEKLKDYVDKTLTMDKVRAINMSELGGYNYCYGVEFVNDTTIKVSNCNCGSIFEANDYINRKFVKAEKQGDLVFIYEKEAFGRYPVNMEYTDDGTPMVNYYKTYARNEEVVETLTSSEFTDQNSNPFPNSTPNWDKYNTYKYTFKLINNNYYFQSFELVK